VRNDPRAALLRLRNAVGVRKCLNPGDLRKAFKDIKFRLQERLDEI